MFYKMAREPDFVKENFNLFIGLAPFAVLRSTAVLDHFFLLLMEFFTPVFHEFGVFAVMTDKQTSFIISHVCGY